MIQKPLSSSFGPDPDAFDISDGCIPKSQLVNNLNPNYRVLSGTLVFDETKEEYILGFPCKDMIEALSTCIDPQTFTKVD